nr:unnamed protein product [Callosobruchus chinensis]
MRSVSNSFISTYLWKILLRTPNSSHSISKYVCPIWCIWQVACQDHPKWRGGPATARNGHIEGHFHSFKISQEYPEDHPIHEDGVSC